MRYPTADCIFFVGRAALLGSAFFGFGGLFVGIAGLLKTAVQIKRDFDEHCLERYLLFLFFAIITFMFKFYHLNIIEHLQYHYQLLKKL